MSSITHTYNSENLASTIELGEMLGKNLRGGEVIELISDVGGGKTALVRGIAKGIGSEDEVTSPSFTINNTYHGNGLYLEHFDFYRLDEPGLLASELREDIFRDETVVVIEWGDIVQSVLPSEKIQITITPTGESSRIFTFVISQKYIYVSEGIW